MFANSQLAGMSITFPDICKTPPVGVPTKRVEPLSL